ncbi:very-long-chain 3-oxoacyl-CoA reductase [Hydra vulgaris]|uniref:Very-long-chain 3-oxoacyl-CoA reductase n=1 Tax=Hydra vulgaris TaxID=6087 RepID=A0ABM4BK23_HYDVU
MVAEFMHIIGFKECLVWFGLVTLLYYLYHTVCFTWMILYCYLLPALGFYKDLKKYGKWAVVTGATDGIGKHYALQLAEAGLNVVLISRTESKLNALAQEIRSLYGVLTKVIVYDFRNPNGYNAIKEELSSMDIGILINNVGISYENSLFLPYHECDLSKNIDVLYTNVFSDVHMTHMVLKGMNERSRGIVVHISSASVYIESPASSFYIPTKSFMTKFVKNLQLNASCFEQQLVLPFFVATNLSQKDPSFFVPTSENYVKQSLRTIGLAKVTHGCLVHEFQAILIKFIPQCFITHFLKKSSKKQN